MKNVLVTGGAGGIGSEIVKKFTENNYFVYFIDIDENNANKLVNKIGPEKCAFIKLDLTNVSEIQNFCKKLKKSFCINHIITLAGRALPNEWKPFEQQELEEISKSVQLNLLSHINTVHCFMPYLKNTKGDKSVLMVSSINATDCFGLPAYSASKSGLYGFMNATVSEFGSLGIRINVLSPGTVVTEATKQEPKDFSKLLKGTALNKFATSQDVANMAYQICNTFSTLTGQNQVLDAGQTKMHNF